LPLAAVLSPALEQPDSSPTPVAANAANATHRRDDIIVSPSNALCGWGGVLR